MKLYEILEIINEGSFVVIYDNEQNIIASYDGKNEIPEKFNNCIINDIFSDSVELLKNSKIIVGAIGIEIDD